MNRTVLEKPFASEQIKQRKGRNGMLDYVEGWSVIQRLNEAFEGAWSFEIPWHEIRETEVLVLGKLTADGITKTQFGASSVTRDRQTKDLVSVGDDLKAAATDALKKCATFLGVGLHLYAEKPLRPPGVTPPPGPPLARPAPTVVATPALAASAAPPATRPVSTPEAPSGPAPATASTPGPGHALLRGGRVTPRQLAAIWQVARAKNLEPGAVEAMSLRVFNRKPDALTAVEASALIKELTSMKRAVA